jgi:hypothetical protein
MATAINARQANVGDLLPPSVVDRRRVRRLEATALLLPGRQQTDAYLDALSSRARDFEAWDGAIAVLEPDGRPDHRLLIVDRYSQVYAVHESRDASDLPDADALEEWFRFLATACPECGVIDDALIGGPTL